MARAVCEQCGENQPVDWKPGDLCVACGAAVRHEVRCAWCAEWVPVGKFCRSCGCEVVNETLYGAARMLKSAGVDRFSLAGKLRELDPEQVRNLSRIYESQLAVVLRRCEEARLCETYLLQKTHSRRLEESLVPLLPMEKEALGTLACGPIGPYGPELLPEIARSSPLPVTRTLAAIALLRQGRTEREFFAAVAAALHSEECELSREAALTLGHWRVRDLGRPYLFGSYFDGGVGLDARRLCGVARAVDPASPLRPWAAAAFALARFSDGVLPPFETADADEAEEWESFRAALRDGLTSSDPDLRFTCALALGDEVVVAGELYGDDEHKRPAARHFLARHKSPAIRRCLAEGSDEIRKEVLDDLWPPLPDELVEPVLQAVEQGDADMRREGAQLLQPTLTPATVDRLVKLALRETDTGVFEILLGAEILPETNTVVRSVIEAGYFQPLANRLSRHIDFSDEAVARLASLNEPEVLETLIQISDEQLRDAQRTAESEEPIPRVLAAGRFLARIAFGPYPAKLRADAYRCLAYRGSSYGGYRLGEWMGPRAVSRLFDSPGEFLHGITGALRDPELGQVCLQIVDELCEHWPELGPLATEYRPAVGELVTALLDLVRTNFLGDRAKVAELLVAMVPLYPVEALPAILALLRDRDLLSRTWNILDRLRDGYSIFGPYLGSSPEALAQAVAALLELLKADDAATDRIRPAAANLLEAIAAEHSRYREVIASEIAPHLPDWTFLSGTREELERLAEVVGITTKASDDSPPVPADSELFCSESQSQLALEALDNEVLLPGNPLPTLGEYCRFLKALGGAANPMEVMTGSGMTDDQYVQSVSAWGEVISRRDDVAIRYGQLMAAAENKANP